MLMHLLSAECLICFKIDGWPYLPLSSLLPDREMSHQHASIEQRWMAIMIDMIDRDLTSRLM